jgi:hypothetical protein
MDIQLLPPLYFFTTAITTVCGVWHESVELLKELCVCVCFCSCERMHSRMVHLVWWWWWYGMVLMMVWYGTDGITTVSISGTKTRTRAKNGSQSNNA